ncbi:MFS transporter [Sphingomonas naphthae]|uniref:MFS transporter n=1 Tax=Sphingomonas naphthae TaxID=1813468 RepID=A0ABY7TLX8_9SPHN|nr:MFS transporter [Sphingomonas naphthae]WCT73766.1 MFS transporter [Sphingomonas naphthae]
MNADANGTAALPTVEQWLDGRSMTPFQIGAVALAAMAILLDGLDNQVMGLAAPSLIREWGVSREALGSIFALGFVGMAAGTVIAGWIGDRLGRRPALILSVGLFGAATTLTGFADSLFQITILKVVAGLGLGGAPASAAAIIAELTPARHRSLAVTAGMVSASLGGILGGAMAAALLPNFGWRSLFHVGGGLTLVTTLLLVFLLPESPRYLATQAARAADLARFAARMGEAHRRFASSILPSPSGKGKVPTRLLFAPGLRRDTLALSAAMGVGLFMIYLMYNWAPTLLVGAGFSMAVASMGLTIFNVGGVIGALGAASMMARFGSRRLLIPMAFAAAILCAALILLPIAGGRNAAILLAGLFALGLFGSAVQSSLYAVGANAFPTALRGRGIGLMSGAGRLGAIVSSLAGAILTGGGAVFFAALAAILALNGAALVLTRRHILPARRDAGGSLSGDGRRL